MSEPRVIKKYPNRRLYDTVESRYITLADIRRLVVEKIDFVVVDKKNNADITRNILLQVITEQEQLAEPMLSQDFMLHVIRAFGSNVHALVTNHLEQSLKSFLIQQPPQRDRARPTLTDPTRVRAPQDEMFKPFSSATTRTRDGD